METSDGKTVHFFLNNDLFAFFLESRKLILAKIRLPNFRENNYARNPTFLCVPFCLIRKITERSGMALETNDARLLSRSGTPGCI